MAKKTLKERLEMAGNIVTGELTAEAKMYLQLDIRDAFLELQRLQEDARKFYSADGTFELLDSAEEVTERRKKAAAEIERLHKIVGPVVDIADEISGKEWPVYEIQVELKRTQTALRLAAGELSTYRNKNEPPQFTYDELMEAAKSD